MLHGVSLIQWRIAKVKYSRGNVLKILREIVVFFVEFSGILFSGPENLKVLD